MSQKKVAVVAIGGNSLIKDAKRQTVEDQYQAAKETTRHIADMIQAGWDVAIGHGNGPQVGFILRKAHQRHVAIFASRIGDLTPPQFAALAFHLTRDGAARKSSQRSYEAESLSARAGHFLPFAGALPPPDAATLAGFASGSALVLLLAGGLAWPRLAFSASMRLMTLPRSGARTTSSLR